MNPLSIIPGIVGATTAINTVIYARKSPSKKPSNKVQLFFICWFLFLLGVSIGFFIYMIFIL